MLFYALLQQALHRASLNHVSCDNSSLHMQGIQRQQSNNWQQLPAVKFPVILNSLGLHRLCASLRARCLAQHSSHRRATLCRGHRALGITRPTTIVLLRPAIVPACCTGYSGGQGASNHHQAARPPRQPCREIGIITFRNFCLQYNSSLAAFRQLEMCKHRQSSNTCKLTIRCRIGTSPKSFH